MKRIVSGLLISVLAATAGACGKNAPLRGTGGATGASSEATKAKAGDPATTTGATTSLASDPAGPGSGAPGGGAPRKWSRVCKGADADFRYLAVDSATVAGKWPSETPFLVDEVSADGEWVLATRARDAKKAWLKAVDTCELDERRTVCSAAKTDLFYADSVSSKSGKHVSEGELVYISSETSNAMDKITFAGNKYWMWSNYLCPYDPNVAVGGAAGSFLSAIAYAEGTKDRYDFVFGFSTFFDYADHPRRSICSGGLCSDAAGRYQILSTTWDGIRSGLGSFAPLNQDEAAKRLIRARGVSSIDTRMDYGSFAASLYKLNNEWASLPGSPYGQPVKTVDELWTVYKSR